MKNSKPDVKAQAHRPKADPKILGRVIKLLYESYPALVVITAICIVFSAVVSSIPALFLQEVIKIIGDYTVSGDWEAARALITPKIITLVCFYVLSILSMLAYTQLMAYITQGFLSKLRCRMFGGMQDLPIKYFDTHKHGDIMSHYTNDIDAAARACFSVAAADDILGCDRHFGSVDHALLLAVAYASRACGRYSYDNHIQKGRRRLGKVLYQTAGDNGQG